MIHLLLKKEFFFFLMILGLKKLAHLIFRYSICNQYCVQILNYLCYCYTVKNRYVTSRHVTSRHAGFIWEHENRTPIGTKVPIMGEFRSLIIYLVLVMLKKRTELKCAFDTMSFKYIFVIAVLLKLGFDAISLCSTF